MRDRNVVEFPTGRRLIRSVNGHETVAALASRLAMGVRLRRRPGLKDRPLPILLTDLTGVSDRTVDTLSALAESRALTTASAARLAMRHAAELGRISRAAERRGEFWGDGCDLRFLGDVFGRYAIMIADRSTEAWVARGTCAGLHMLFDLCPAGSGPIYLLPPLDPTGRSGVVLRRPKDWRRALSRLTERHDPPSEHPIVVVGGLPRSGRRRAAAISAIERGLRPGNVRDGIAGVSVESEFMESTRNRPTARRHLSMIEMACPGLLRIAGFSA